MPLSRLRAALDDLPRESLRGAGIRGWKAVDDACYDTIRAVVRDLPGSLL